MRSANDNDQGSVPNGTDPILIGSLSLHVRGKAAAFGEDAQGNMTIGAQDADI